MYKLSEYQQSEALNIFLQAVALALHELESDPPYSAQRTLSLVLAKFPRLLDETPQVSPQERDSMMCYLLGNLAMLRTLVESYRS